MKFTPLPSTSPKVLMTDSVNADVDERSVKLAAIYYPLPDRSVLSIGIGTGHRTVSAILSVDQAISLTRKLQSLIASL